MLSFCLSARIIELSQRLFDLLQLFIAAAQFFRLLAAFLYQCITLLSLLLQLLYLHAQAFEFAHRCVGFLTLGTRSFCQGNLFIYMFEGFDVLCHFAGLVLQAGNVKGQALQMLGLVIALLYVLTQLVEGIGIFFDEGDALRKSALLLADAIQPGMIFC